MSWFPVGWFLDAHKAKGLDHATDPDPNFDYGTANQNGNLWDLAYRYNKGHLYNCIYARSAEDFRNRTNVTDQTYYDRRNTYGITWGNILGATRTFSRMLDTMSTLNGISYADGNPRQYKMMAPLLAKIINKPTPPEDLIVPPHFMNSPYRTPSEYTFTSATRLPWDLFSTHTYYPSSLSWSNEDSAVTTLVNYIKNHSNLAGWVYCDEPFGGKTAQDKEPFGFGGFRAYLYDQMKYYKNLVSNLDANHLFYANLRNYGNFFTGTSSPPPSYWTNFLDIFDCIMDSGVYMTDLMRPDPYPDKWEDGDNIAQWAMGYTSAPYIRWMETHTENYLTENNLVPENYRYMAYSSWVNGGQGVMFYNLNYNNNSDWLTWTDEIAQEANAMKPWLMGQHATNISATIRVDNGADHRVRFILKRSTDQNEQRVLCLFTVSVKDNAEHTVYINFPNHQIVSIPNQSQIVDYYSWSFEREDNYHTLRVGTRDVWGRAFLLTLQ